MELDKDLQAIQQARNLAKQAEDAQKILAQMPQAKLDEIVRAVAKAFSASASELAEMAVRETGFGNVKDKITKNEFASNRVLAAIENMTCVGVLKENNKEKLWEIGVPVGVIAAIVPSTNPTSTVCYKAMIALKSGNSIVFSPHPKAICCTLKAAEIVAKAAESAGAPKGSVGCLTIPSMAGCNELMHAAQTRLILATGGPAMVKAAYSSGKPAIGVGAGNGPVYIHRSADVDKALSSILRSKTFDYGTVCASEQSMIVEAPMEQTVREKAAKMGFYFMNKEEAGCLAKLLFKPNGTLNPEIVGKSALCLAEKAGFSVARDTQVLVAREQEAGPTRPYSMEKLCPVLAFFVMESEDAVLEKAIEVLIHEGSGHTFAMHAEDETVIRKFALQIPVSRFLVNTPAALGGIGGTTGLFPALTLGCGAVGGSSSSNNISPMDLINIRRVAWGTEGETPKNVDNDLVEMLTAKILERLK
ncbi:MAG: acetaldehyde dehydrogenase (acetylating) [Oscillospiraceae bacterium]|nr:acetaldehyde dehydrogenase (acetylating) [Oscillospiraceae bacterium]